MTELIIDQYIFVSSKMDSTINREKFYSILVLKLLYLLSIIRSNSELPISTTFDTRIYLLYTVCTSKRSILFPGNSLTPKSARVAMRPAMLISQTKLSRLLMNIT